MNLIKYLIFGKTKSQGIQFLENLIKDIPKENIARYIKSFNECRVHLIDGTIYQVASASDSSRGHKCHKAYISYDVDKDIVDNVIKPCIIGNWDDNRIVYY